MTKRLSVLAKASAEWIRTKVDPGDVVALLALAIAYDGAVRVFGTGWARLGVGAVVLALYGLVEANKLLRLRREQSGGKR